MTATGTVAPVDLQLSLDVVDGLPVLALSGSVDLATVPELQDGLVRLVTDHPGARVAVDLDGVEVIDDTALGLLLGAAGRARQAGGDVVIVCARERLRARFSVTGLDRAVSVVGGIAELLTS
jgi:anti-sigma B factor antagonist